ncbi:MAG: rane-bound dehydrogenase domain protein [Schlesneria sp.]|nr:rane-bound dehydrogenase domain protein [Schlesneria sp.]
MRSSARLLCLFGLLALTSPLLAQQPKPVIPHAQDKPPNDPRDPETAAKLMTVPEGFTVEVVAAEPDIVNPVAMAIDERGRFWVTESLEYPRREPGPGKDRVKILEDTDGDGRMDKFTVFLDGLNIPSGIAVGHGGVWVVNSPDILFVQDTDGDGKADKQEVVVTGFGRADTHELPNSLTWGPDGWLYGLNGVFNHSHVKYSKTNPNYKEDHKGWPLTCAMFRIHPRTREFQVFCEGTSNPWGIAFNDEGEAFVSACVIDHLWHLVETGYYHRQGGPYPPFTWKIESIVKHKHQKAAYCGIHYFDSDAYPEQYRGKLYMGNIHGGCINVDRVERDGSTYKGIGEPDFLTANDAWFMPVVQKTGPDGSLYVLDWYDRYHCYQDANRDPAGIDRLKGRLYRVRYKDTPRVPKEFDLAKESDAQLIERLGAKNDFIRWTATRLLQERLGEQNEQRLADFANGITPFGFREADQILRRFHASCVVASLPYGGRTFGDSSAIRALNLRVAGSSSTGRQLLQKEIDEVDDWSLLRDEDPQVQLQRIIALGKLKPTRNVIRGMFDILAKCEKDPLIPRIFWLNIHPHIENHPGLIVETLELKKFLQHDVVIQLIPRITDRLLGRQKFDAKPVAELFTLLRDDHPEVGRDVLAVLATKVQTGELKGEKLDQLKTAMFEPLTPLLTKDATHPLGNDAALLAVSWGDQRGLPYVRRTFGLTALRPEHRLKALSALVAVKDEELYETVNVVLKSDPSSDFQGKVLAVLGQLDDPRVAMIVLANYPQLAADLQPRAIELLTQRAAWAKQLLTAVGEKKIPATAINLNQARRLKDLKDQELTKLLATNWGQVREGRDPNREQYIAEMKSLIRKSPGDEAAGEKAFKKVCAQCHKIYGEGAEVGPDISRNGRNDFTQLLSNVFDPSLVIGAGYRSYTVITNGGRVLNGLLAEDSPQRIVLKVQGGKQEVIARSDIDEFNVSEISLMPEQLEKQLSQQEIVDLFAFITLDKHPSDPTARQLPGVTQVALRESTNAAEYPSIIAEVLPGFTTSESGELGVGLLPEYRGRDNVLRTHPVSRDKPCVLSMKLTPPADKKTKLILDVSHDPRGDWRLVVRGNGQRMADEMISKETCPNGWRTLTIDLSKFAGQELKLDLVNQANDWAWEFAYWGGAKIVSD